MGPHLDLLLLATQPRQGVQSGLGVARHLDLGDDGDVALGGIAHDVANLLLRKEIGAIGNAVVGGRAQTVADEGLVALRSEGSQLGIAFDLDAPPLVIRQVPMEAVELVGGQDVEVAFHLLDREEVAHDVHVCSTIGEVGRILNRAAGDAIRMCYDKLTE